MKLSQWAIGPILMGVALASCKDATHPATNVGTTTPATATSPAAEKKEPEGPATNHFIDFSEEDALHAKPVTPNLGQATGLTIQEYSKDLKAWGRRCIGAKYNRRVVLISAESDILDDKKLMLTFVDDQYVGSTGFFFDWYIPATPENVARWKGPLRGSQYFVDGDHSVFHEG